LASPKKTPQYNFNHEAFKEAMKEIHQAEKVNPEALNFKAVKKLIHETDRALSQAVKFGIADNVIPEAMAKSLAYDTFMFSGLKVYNQLKEGGLKLRNEEGRIKSFDKFYQDVKAIDETYNRSYLQAEYNFAVHSAQAAARWADVEADGDEYNLQYRTAADDRVRDEHAILNQTTLPPSDSFWSFYYPPNGWNCRCIAVQVLKDKYPLSDPAQAMQNGYNATTKVGKDGSDKGSIFRFNPGKQNQVFPPSHPYRSSKCANCDNAKLQLSANIPQGEKCQACKILQKEHQKSQAAIQRDKYLKEMKPLLDKSVEKQTDSGNITIKFTKKGNKHLYHDALGRTKGMNKDDLKKLDAALRKATFVKSAPLYKERKDSITKFYYYKDKDKELYYNVAEKRKIEKDGRIDINRFLYAITNNIQ
jgi:SPP1 gp7 family putative phage head morphogenesis protein